MEHVQTLPPRSGVCDIVLVSCYELGHEPLGVLTPAGVLDRAGYRARVLDVAVSDFDPAQVKNERLIAISTPMHTALRLGVRVAAHVRQINPDAHICFFGLYAGLHAPWLLPDLADTCLGAEFEGDLLDLVATIARDGETIPRAVRLATTPRPAARTKQRALDLAPRRSASDHGRYVRLAIDGAERETGYVSATRGCKHTCRHCPIPAAYEGSFYALPVDDVLRDIDAAIALGARHITFADADFLNGPTHALRVSREHHRRHPDVTFDYTAKIEHLLRLPDVVDELQSLGNIFVVSAVESFNDDVLRRLHKGHTADQALEVFRAFERRGLTLRPSLVPFTPWETRESLAALFSVVANEGLADRIDSVQYSIRLLVPAGSLLMRDPDTAACFGPFDPARFTHGWAHPDPAMDAIQRQLAAISDEASRVQAPVEETFLRMAAVVSPSLLLSIRKQGHDSVPRLTEDWFC
jgi:radical SAM superfamily enzyme YgiQ (UPF0313 family)